MRLKLHPCICHKWSETVLNSTWATSFPQISVTFCAQFLHIFVNSMEGKSFYGVYDHSLQSYEVKKHGAIRRYLVVSDVIPKMYVHIYYISISLTISLSLSLCISMYIYIYIYIYIYYIYLLFVLLLFNIECSII